jgi:hypothetical protein
VFPIEHHNTKFNQAFAAVSWVTMPAKQAYDLAKKPSIVTNFISKAGTQRVQGQPDQVVSKNFIALQCLFSLMSAGAFSAALSVSSLHEGEC